MALILTAAQRRVLGVMIEKALTVPDQYPLTLNALLAGCNQKSNRHPVYEFAEGDVADTVQELMRMQLIRRAEIALGARSVRFQHQASSTCGWSPREQAILAELLLRGPQTVGELRTRCDRMHRMPDLRYVEGILAELSSQDPPLVRILPRAPGQSTVRYAHLFYPENDQPDENFADPGPTSSTNRSASNVSDLEKRLAELEQRVAALEARP